MKKEKSLIVKELEDVEMTDEEEERAKKEEALLAKKILE